MAEGEGRHGAANPRILSPRPRIGAADCTFRVLGPVTFESEDAVVLTRETHRRLLSILLLLQGTRTSTDLLIERFWPGQPPRTAKAAMHTHLSALRRLLPTGTIVTEGSGYRLPLDGHRLDAIEFTMMARRAARAAATTDRTAVVSVASHALALWRGAPFEELADDDFARPEIVRLEETRISLVELRAETLLALGRAAEATPELEQLVVLYPLREHLAVLLAEIRSRTGRQVEALRLLRATGRALGELGLEPSSELGRMEQQILAPRIA